MGKISEQASGAGDALPGTHGHRADRSVRSALPVSPGLDAGRFFVGYHELQKVQELDACCVSANRLVGRRSEFRPNRWILDSGAFTQVALRGGFSMSVEEYAQIVRRFARCGQLWAVVAQDFMCEPFVLSRTGATVEQHQAATVERFDELRRCDLAGRYLMPVLQGWAPADYARHLAMYGDRIGAGAWVGVGSVCKRQGNATAVADVLEAILSARPDLRLHGFGVKLSSLADRRVSTRLWSADSMAWSFAARRQGRNANCVRTAKSWASRVCAGFAS